MSGFYVSKYMSKIKRCSKCKINKSINDFPKHKSHKDGLDYWCKECYIKPCTKEKRKILEDRNKKGLKLCSKCGVEKNLSEFYKRKISKDGLCSWCNLCYSKKSKIYRLKNYNTIVDYQKRYRKKNEEKIKVLNKKWYEKNGKEYYKNRQKEKINSDLNYKLKHNISSSIYHKLKASKSSKNRKSTFKDILNYTVQELREDIECKFEVWMNWDNYGQGYGKWCIDHIKPQDLFDFSDINQIKECWSLENLQPMEFIKNIKKSNKY